MAPRRLRASDQVSSPATSQTASLKVDDDTPIPPFFNTTFSTHRVSPLYIGSQELNTSRLEQLGSRLRDTLVGDVVRGIQIGLESTETASGQVGPLRSVKLRWFRATEILGDDIPDGTEQNASGKGLWIEIRHENAAYVALLLPGLSAASERRSNPPQWATRDGEVDEEPGALDSHFMHLPLLLLRMPLPLKMVISDWLSTTFDCRVSKLALGTRSLVNAWERWIEATSLSSRGPDLVITLALHTAVERGMTPEVSDSEDELNKSGVPTEPGLRSMEITIAARDLRRFAREGEALPPERKRLSTSWEHNPRERRRLAGDNADDGWGWRGDKKAPKQPFTEALARYLDHHLALNMFHPSVKVAQISCGGFVLAQSRMKIMRIGELSDELSRAAWTFVTLLGDRISADPLPAVF